MDRIICGDCLELLPQVADKCIDMILCDLPYGLTKNKWDEIIPLDELWKQYNRIIKDNGAIVLTASQPFTSTLVMSNPAMFKYEWIWEKNKAGNFLNAKKQPLKVHENVLVFAKGQTVYNPQFWYSTPYKRWNTQKAVDKQTNYNQHKCNVVKSEDGRRYPLSTIKVNRHERPIHPTQKPLGLFEYLIKTYTNEGEVVLDNCIGVGTTAVAAKNTSRHFIGMEIDKKYCRDAEERLNEEHTV